MGEDGRAFYGECSDYERPLSLCNDFVCAVVLPQLGPFLGRSMPFAELGDELLARLLAVPLKPKPAFCRDSDYQRTAHQLGRWTVVTPMAA